MRRRSACQPLGRTLGRLLLLVGVFQLATLAREPLNAQAATFRLVDSASAAPVEGALVQLVAGNGELRQLGVTDRKGVARMQVPPGERLLVRVARIGFRAGVVDSIRLAAGDSLTRLYRVVGVPLLLETIQVERASRCRALPADEAGDLATVWQEVRKALTLSRLSERAADHQFDVEMSVVDLDYSLDTLGRTTESNRLMRPQPFVTADIARIEADGWVARDTLSGLFDFLGPDPAILLSDFFANTHCFRLTRESADSALIGLAFAPIDEHRADITGTLWVDRRSAGLRRLDYRYELFDYRTKVFPGEATRHDPKRIGGRLDFARLPDGAWIISGWAIRLPWIAGYREEGQQVVRAMGPGFDLDPRNPHPRP